MMGEGIRREALRNFGGPARGVETWDDERRFLRGPAIGDGRYCRERPVTLATRRDRAMGALETGAGRA